MTKNPKTENLKHRHENNWFMLSIIIYRHERSEIERHLWIATDHA
jgi:hypothetical protein